MGAMQAILREMETRPATSQPRQRYVVSPRHWVQQQRREAQLRTQHLRIRILKQQQRLLQQQQQR